MSWFLFSFILYIRTGDDIRMKYLYKSGFKEYLSIYEPRCFSMSNIEYHYSNYSSVAPSAHITRSILFIKYFMWKKKSLTLLLAFLLLQMPQSVFVSTLLFTFFVMAVHVDNSIIFRGTYKPQCHIN